MSHTTSFEPAGTQDYVLAGTVRPEVPEDDSIAPPPRSRPPWLSVLGHVGVALLALWVASIVIFFSLHYLPGDLAAIKAGTEATQEEIEAIRVSLGLDRPVWVQYWDWFSGVLRFDFGVSSLSHLPISGQLLQMMAVTGPIALASLLVALVISIPLGALAAVRRHGGLGQVLQGLTQVGVAVPVFVFGILLVDLFSVRAKLLPATGFPTDGWSDPIAATRSLVLPVITLTIPQVAVLARFVRSATIDVLHRDHLRTARAQGLSGGRALLQSWRMVALPLSGVIALDFAGLITGAVIAEQVFALPGVGSFMLSSVSARDITVVQSVLMMLSGMIIIFMALATLVQDLLDPRLRS
ncbi:ABC transporter permease [Tessaracoccus sp. SD287]|uniref:ABC transporter permease n=1 Tax=Tessaracoccus sp. SD287 TaxID=2782008 RepID=UPI001A97540E|nr:ABC transporter permease [Tessaracoccus sp. SD287]MBO1030939.1 ABC transporter permease [Tessaracoccus sp. SD287]